MLSILNNLSKTYVVAPQVVLLNHTSVKLLQKVQDAELE